MNMTRHEFLPSTYRMTGMAFPLVLLAVVSAPACSGSDEAAREDPSSLDTAADPMTATPNCSALTSSPIFQVINPTTKGNLLTASQDARAPSGITASTPMPVGNLPGWTMVYSEDFNAPLDTKNVWGVYDGTVSGANPNTSGWSASHVVVSNGQLHLNGYVDKNVRPDGRVVTGGLGLWNRPPQMYGKWEMLVRIDACPDVKYAWLLWPSDNNWPSGGEIDYAEDGGGSRATTTATIHYANAAGQDTILPQDSVSPTPNFSSWHVVGVEWTSTAIRYTLDGQYWGNAKTSNLPPRPMVFVVQTEGVLAPNKVTLGTGQCNAQIGWVVQYKPAGQ